MGTSRRGHRSRVHVAAAAALAALLAVAAACGSDDEADSTSPASADETVATGPEVDTADTTEAADATESTADAPTAVPDATDDATAPTGDGTAGTDDGTASPAPPELDLTELEEAARAEGKLHIYVSFDPYTADQITAAFEEKYGIETEYTRLVTGPLNARYAAEAEAGAIVADVLFMSNYQFFDTAVENGWMKPLTTELVPNLETVGEEFLLGNSVVAGFTLLSNVLINTDAVDAADVPDLEGLLDPRWKDNLYMHDPRGVTAVLAYHHLLTEMMGVEYMESLAAQNPEWVESLGTATQLVAAGEKDIALGVGQTHMNTLLAEAPDAPIALYPLPEAQFGNVWAAGLSENSPSPNAARLFVTWLLTPEGQLVFNEMIGPSVVPGVEVPGWDPFDNLIQVDHYVAEENRAELLARMGLTE